MSGPKISTYNLSPEARKNLNEQILCERRCSSYAKEIRKLLVQLLGSRAEAEEELARLELLQERTAGCEEEINALQNFLASVSDDAAQFTALLQSEQVKPASAYVLTEQELQVRRDRVKRLRKLKQTVMAYGKPIADTLAGCREKRSTHSQQISRAITADLDTSVSFNIRTAGEKEKLESEKAEIAMQLSALLRQENCPALMKLPLQNAVEAVSRIETADHLRSFRSITADPLVKRYHREVERIAAERMRYEECVESYVSLCALLGIPEVNCIPDDIIMLEQMIQQLEQQLIKEREQEYIAACLDEVMVEMGYDLIGSREVTKKSGKRFRNELYTFCEGTAVNVTYSSDGQIAMELGGIAREDRLPTGEETDVLVKEMEAFCADFEQIEQRLAKKGVVLESRIALSPPSAEYAAIINVGEYDVAAGKEVVQLQTGSNQKKAAVKKVMHRRDE